MTADLERDYYAFRGPEILASAGEGRAVFSRDPFSDTPFGRDGHILDSFPLKTVSASEAKENAKSIRVLSLASDAPAPDGCEWVAFRSFLGTAGPAELGGAFRALALVNWRASTKFCGRCGSPQGEKPDETARLCPKCGSVTYPRLSPAVLALVHRDGKVLLARNASFRGGIFSILAGFVEPGESFEECVAREVEEEVGIRVGNIRYKGSQPWPFPDSLMIGFEADWESGELKPDGVEIAEAGWYTRTDHPPLPLSGSLSRRLLDGVWGGGEIPRG